MIPLQPKSPTKAPVQAYPITKEKEYNADLRRIVTQIDRMLRDDMEPIARKLEAQLKAEAEFLKLDNSDEFARELLKVIESVGEAAESIYIAPDDLEDLAAAVAEYSQAAVNRQVAAMGVINAVEVTSHEAITAELISAFAEYNAELIVTLKSRYLTKVAKAVEATITEGFSWQSLSKALTTRLNVSRHAADRIAVDQIGTLNAQITRKRQQELGIQMFKWSTSDDGNVRPEHEAIDGNEYSWASGDPVEGFPGMPIRCRCSAIPIIPSVTEV